MYIRKSAPVLKWVTTLKNVKFWPLQRLSSWINYKTYIKSEWPQGKSRWGRYFCEKHTKQSKILFLYTLLLSFNWNLYNWARTILELLPTIID